VSRKTDAAENQSTKADTRHAVFAREYVIDLNATRAAIAAGYSKKTAYSAGARLLRNVEVQKLIESLTEKRAAKLDITADRVLGELAKMAFANMDDYIKTTATGDAFIDLSKLSRNHAAAIQEITVDEYTEGRGDEARQVKRTRFKLADKRGSLELLGKHLKLFTDKVEHGGQIGEYRIVTNVGRPPR
jgi:phage terminase small subunit